MTLDLIAVGRCMVDLYCDQVGSPIDYGQSLSMYVGGCPTNVAVGAARLGLRVAMLTRVGADGTGRFVVETLRREGVDTRRVKADPACLTPVVVVGIEPPDRFPIDWYRERPADLALAPEDYDDAFLASARAVLVSGNSLSRPAAAETLRDLVQGARRVGTPVVYDLDFRPVLWQASPGEIARELQSLLGAADLLVGTEEEYCALFHLADAAEAYRRARRSIPGVAVLKQGPRGAVVAGPGEEPRQVSGFPVEVLNPLGAGDAFLAGFVAAWLEGRPLVECARRANASGALVASRHGCAPAMPYRAEVERFLETYSGGPGPHDPRRDPEIQRLHMAGRRDTAPRPLLVAALDHRAWFRERASPDRIEAFKLLAVRALSGEAGVGFLLDRELGARALQEAERAQVWVGEPLERCSAEPLELLGPGGDPALALRERPRTRAVKLLVRCPGGEPDPVARRLLPQVQAACDAYERDLVLEVLSPRLEATLEALKGLGMRPTFWKLPLPGEAASWERLRAIVGEDPTCRGVLFLGGGEPLSGLADRFPLVASDPLARGFAVGRSLFAEPFARFMGGDPEGAARDLGRGFRRLAEAWRAAAESGSSKRDGAPQG